MARYKTKTHRMTVKELVQQQRNELYATGHQNMNMMLSQGVIAQIDALKVRYKLRSRDAVVGRVIRKCASLLDPDDFVWRAGDPDEVYRRISPIVPADLAAYVKQIQSRFRHIGYGPVFEMILAEVGSDLSPVPVQLELIRGAEA